MDENKALEILRKYCDYGKDVAKLDQICAALGEPLATVRAEAPTNKQSKPCRWEWHAAQAAGGFDKCQDCGVRL